MSESRTGRAPRSSGAGSESGIGMAIARRLGAAGARLLVTASSARIAERVAELRAAGFTAEGRALDLTEEAAVGEFCQWAEARWGRIDILVNNAGMAMQGSPEPLVEVALRRAAGGASSAAVPPPGPGRAFRRPRAAARARPPWSA